MLPQLLVLLIAAPHTWGACVGCTGTCGTLSLPAWQSTIFETICPDYVEMAELKFHSTDGSLFSVQTAGYANSMATMVGFGGDQNVACYEASPVKNDSSTWWTISPGVGGPAELFRTTITCNNMASPCPLQYSWLQQCMACDCAGKVCGDECGRSCGSCAPGTTCENHQCVAPCVRDCAGKTCGKDGCGGTCGACGDGEACTDGQCAPVCTRQCAGKTCGADGCGGTCGACDGGLFCVNGACVAPTSVPTPVPTPSAPPQILASPTPRPCTPLCDGRTCGSDACGGLCGVCDGTCTSGTCVMPPGCYCQCECDGRIAGFISMSCSKQTTCGEALCQNMYPEPCYEAAVSAVLVEFAGGKKSNHDAIAGAVVGVLAGVAAISAAIYYRRRRSGGQQEMN